MGGKGGIKVTNLGENKRMCMRLKHHFNTVWMAKQL